MLSDHEWQDREHPNRERSNRALTGTSNGKRLQEEIVQKKGTDTRCS